MLSNDVRHYVERHRTLGYKYRVQDRLLRNFAAFAQAHGDEAVHTQRALDWAGQAPSPQQRRNRLLTLRRFAQAMQAEDARYQVPPAEAFGRVAFKRRTPHIFTAKEIMALLKAAARLTPKDSIRPATYTTLFALLAATGLRSCEALALTLDAPDPAVRAGIRDRAMLHLAFAAGLRVSELVGLRLDDIERVPQPAIHVHGKGRRERPLPLWKETMAALRAWLAVLGEGKCRELFLNAVGAAMSRSGFEYILAKHVKSAAQKQPSLDSKRVSPHVLRHTCAMHTLQATRDVRKVALWLGHASLQSTEMYLRADPSKLLAMLHATKKDARYAEW
jgi:site-specific recombinase XerD